MPKLLLIDDEPVIQHAFRKAFHPPEYETAVARTAADGLVQFSTNRPDVVILDVHLPDADRLQAFDKLKKLDARTPIILITGHGTTDLAIEAMKRGAFDYLLKPLPYDELTTLVRRACASSRLMKVPAVLGDAAAPDTSDALIGRCPAMQAAYKKVGRVAGTDATVLILGETGTGKELIARAVYQHSKRSDKPFLAINCGAIPENLIESELFGHERGAFTGADQKRIGKFEQCHGGTLFLDEVGELPPMAQVKLLRVLQEQKFERVGGNETVTTDVRLIAATNNDMADAVARGTLRGDLYFRLNVFSIEVPPLRERGEDLDLLTDHFLAKYAKEFGNAISPLPDDTRAALHAYRWPGNVRELQSVLKHGLLQMRGSVLHREDLSFPKPKDAKPATGSTAGRSTLDWDTFVSERYDSGSGNLYEECLTLMERQLFTRVLQRTGGNQVKAAEVLGITRGTLRVKLKLLGITVEKAVCEDIDPAG